MPLISLANVSKAYAGIPALREVSLDLEGGEIHALMGENGAGKSTLIKILAGVVAPDTADIRIDGNPVVIDSPRAAHRLGLRFIHQELSVVPALSVAENIFLGRTYPLRARSAGRLAAAFTARPRRPSGVSASPTSIRARRWRGCRTATRCSSASRAPSSARTASRRGSTSWTSRPLR